MTGSHPREGTSLTVLSRRLQQVATAGEWIVSAPLHLVDSGPEGMRAAIRREARRALGMPERPVGRAPATDPATAYLDPAGLARRVHADLPSMVVAGLAALLLQTLHPLAMAGVADHSNYRDDPHGRLRRTAEFIAATTFGTVEEANVAIERVRRVHRHVHGVAPDGRPYAADDPDLVTWIHVAEIAMFLHGAERLGPERFSAADRDAYISEMSIVAHALGAHWAPRTMAEVAAYFERMRPSLYAGDQALEARDFLLRGVAQRCEDRAVYALLAAGAVALLPRWARTALRIPALPLVDTAVALPLARGVCTALRWAVSE